VTALIRSRPKESVGGGHRHSPLAGKSNGSPTTAPGALGDKPGKAPASRAADARAAFAALDWELVLYCAQAENDCASSSEDDRDSGFASVLGGSGGGTG